MVLSRKKRIGIVAGALVLAGMGIWAGLELLPLRAMKLAQNDLSTGYSGLAEDRLDCYRRKLVGRAEGCSLLVQVYYRNRNMARLQWASESCLRNGFQTPDVILGMVAYLQSVSREDEAASILVSAGTKFTTNPIFPYELGRIYLKNGKKTEGERAYDAAIKRGRENPRVVAEVAAYYLSQKETERAKSLAHVLASYADEGITTATPYAVELLEKVGEKKRAEELRKTIKGPGAGSG